MSAHEKAAGMLDTSEAAYQNVHVDSTPHQKRLATLRARCALAGVTLYPIEDDHGKTVYIVSRWAMTRELASLDALEKWLDMVIGGAA